MKKLPNEAFGAMYQLMQEKVAYDNTIKDWQRPGGIAGLFARPPRDPFPDGRSELVDLVSAAFRGAFPEAKAYQAGPEGPGDFSVDFSAFVNHEGELHGRYHAESKSHLTFSDEFFEFKPGYGLRHSYSHSDDPEQDAANRSYAYSRAMGSRLEFDAFFKRMNQFCDKMCNDLRFVERVHLEPRELSRYVQMVRDFRKEESIESSRVSTVAREAAVPVKDLAEYVESRSELYRRTDKLLAGKLENTAELRAIYAVESSACDTYRNHSLVNRLCELTWPVVPVDRTLDFAMENHVNHSSREVDNSEAKAASLFTFANLARRDGWLKPDIMRVVEDEALKFGLALSSQQRHGIESVIDSVDSEKRKLVDSVIRSGVTEGKGPAEILEQVKSAFNSEIVQLVRENESVERGKAFLAELYGEGGRKEVTYEKLAKAVVDWDTGASTLDVARAFSVEQGSGLRDYAVDGYRRKIDAAVEDLNRERFVAKAGKTDLLNVAREIMEGTKALPVALLARDLAVVAFDKMKNDPDSLAGFLGSIKAKPNGLDNLSDTFLLCAHKMYDGGSADAARNITQFRSDYARQLEAGSSMIRAAQSRPKVVEAKAQGVKL